MSRTRTVRGRLGRDTICGEYEEGFGHLLRLHERPLASTSAHHPKAPIRDVLVPPHSGHRMGSELTLVCVQHSTMHNFEIIYGVSDINGSVSQKITPL